MTAKSTRASGAPRSKASPKRIWVLMEFGKFLGAAFATRAAALREVREAQAYPPDVIVAYARASARRSKRR